MSIYSTPDPVAFPTRELMDSWSYLSAHDSEELRRSLGLSVSTCKQAFAGYSLQASRDRLDDN